MKLPRHSHLAKQRFLFQPKSNASKRFPAAWFSAMAWNTRNSHPLNLIRNSPKSTAQPTISLTFHVGKKLERNEPLEISQDLLEQGESFAKLLSFAFGKPVDCFGEKLHAAFARFPHQADAFGRSFEAHAAAVFRGMPTDESGALEAGDDATHGGWPDLLSVGELAERLWSAEDEDGESGKLGGADVGFAVADAKAAQQMNGGGMELVGDFRGCLGRR